MTDIKIYQGNQIGGCITVISTDNTKIVIDFGESLPGAEKVENIDFDWENEKVDAVFFTHYHGDHIGRFMEIPDDVDLYMGEVTWKVLVNLNTALKNNEIVNHLKNRPNIYFVNIQKTINVGDIKVTPYAVDHSAFDAYMFLIETPDKNILHTGDYRDHGHRGHTKWPDGTDKNVMIEVINRYVRDNGKRKIDFLITEGTMIGNRKNDRRYSEKQMLKDAMKIFKDNKYVFLKISSTNVDSLATFYHAARENGMGFYANRYVLSQLNTFSEAGRKYTRLYDFSDKWPILLKPTDNASEDYLRSFNSQRKHMREDGFVMLVSEYEYYEDIMEEFADLNPIMIFSLWKGYIDEEIGKGAYNAKLAEFCKRHRAIEIHTSGHAYPEFIEEVKKAVGAKEVIMIHTEPLFKDSKLVIHKSSQKEALKEIGKLIRESKQIEEAENRINYLRKHLLNGQISETSHKPNHEKCERPKTDRVTEKRICRCMRYYNQESALCKECPLSNKWRNLGKIKITDFEVPMMHKYVNVGGMDLIFDRKYAVEVKPPKSTETLARMFAEILTYTIETDPDGNQYVPAICIFNTEGNSQMEQFKELMKERNEDLLYIIENIKVFYFEISSLKDGVIDYSIHSIDDWLIG